MSTEIWGRRMTCPDLSKRCPNGRDVMTRLELFARFAGCLGHSIHADDSFGRRAALEGRPFVFTGPYFR
jgi:hypothetical protein